MPRKTPPPVTAEYMVGNPEFKTVKRNRSTSDSISDLHKRCGIYTDRKIASMVLRKIGWTCSRNLGNKRFLEPCCGDGVFLICAIRELLRSFRKYGKPLHFQTLSKRIVAFEIHPVEAAKARDSIVRELSASGVNARLALRLADEWVRTEDFLVTQSRIGGITHVGANPPYVRWSNVPSRLGDIYRSALPKEVTTGDLSVAFFARIIDAVPVGTSIGILSSDRWLYSVRATAFRNKWLPKVKIDELIPIAPSVAFQRSVSISPLISVFIRKDAESSDVPGTEINAGLWSSPKMRIYHRHDNLEVIAKWRRLFPPIEDAGCRIRVGPALGHEPAFVGSKDDLGVEEELLAPYVAPHEIVHTQIHWRGRYALCAGTPDGELIDLSVFPLARARLNRFKKHLKKRSCVGSGNVWFKTIDRTVPGDWTEKKILVPELSRSPSTAYDDIGLMPSHGIYAIFSDEWPTEILSYLLSSGILYVTLDAIAPRMRSGSIRCYKRFLAQIPVPKWGALSDADRAALVAHAKQRNHLRFMKKVARIYGVEFEFLNGYSTCIPQAMNLKIDPL